MKKTTTIIITTLVCLFAITLPVIAETTPDVAKNKIEEGTDIPSYDRPTNALANDREEENAAKREGSVRAPAQKEANTQKTTDATNADTSLNYEAPACEVSERTGTSLTSVAVSTEKLTNLAAGVCGIPGNALAAIPCAAVQSVNLISKIVRLFGGR